MDAETFQRLAEEAYAELPELFHRAIENVVIVTDEEADADTLAEMGCASPRDLLGLYSGWPLPERGASYGNHPPDMIHLYRLPILAEAEANGESPEELLREVLIHEIGHYFGFDDAQMHKIEEARRQKIHGGA